MNSEKILQKDYIANLKERIPKNLIIEKISDKKIHIVNEYLKSRERLEFNFSELTSHFGDNWNYEEYPLGYIMRNTDNYSIVGFFGTICSRRQINNHLTGFYNLAFKFL